MREYKKRRRKEEVQCTGICVCVYVCVCVWNTYPITFTFSCTQPCLTQLTSFWPPLFCPSYNPNPLPLLLYTKYPSSHLPNCCALIPALKSHNEVRFSMTAPSISFAWWLILDSLSCEPLRSRLWDPTNIRDIPAHTKPQNLEYPCFRLKLSIADNIFYAAKASAPAIAYT